MRSGHRHRKAHDLVTDDTGRTLVTCRFAADVERRHINVIRRAAEPVACDVATGALLWDAGELGERLRAIPRARQRQTRDE